MVEECNETRIHGLVLIVCQDWVFRLVERLGKVSLPLGVEGESLGARALALELWLYRQSGSSQCSYLECQRWEQGLQTFVSMPEEDMVSGSGVEA